MNNNPKKNLSFLNPPPAFKFIFINYLILLAFFSLNRYIFHNIFDEQISIGTSSSDIITSYLIGLRFDTVFILMLLIPLTLITPWLKLDNNIFKRIVFSYLTIIGLFSFFVLFADIRFYHFFDTHLNFLAYEYLSNSTETSNLIFEDKYFWPTLLGTLAETTIFLILSWLTYRKITKTRIQIDFKKSALWFIIFVLLFVAGIRGRLDLAPLDWGMAYFSKNHTLNQSSLNGLYTLMRNFNESNHDPRLSYRTENERFPFVSRESALTYVQNLLKQDGAVYTYPKNSIERKISTPDKFPFKPNIVLVIMESWAGRYTSTVTLNDSLTPNFDNLADSGILFTNCFGSGYRTNFGIAATLCSFPALPGRAILKRYEAAHPFTSLSEILKDKGYYNSFIYGGDLAFDNMEGFLRTKGFDGFFGESDFEEQHRQYKWGVPDEVLFNHTVDLTDTLPRPFLLTALTLSNHEPWDLPDSSVQRFFDDSDESKRMNSAIYADYAFGKFIDSIKEKPVFDSTIFIFVSDHSQIYPSYISLNPSYFHIPMLIYSKLFDDIEPVRIDKYCSQIDMIPTLLGLIGGEYQFESWGRDIMKLAPSDSGFALLNLYTRIGIIDPSYLYFEEGKKYQRLFRNYNHYFLNLEADTAITDPILLDIVKPRQEILYRFMQLADQMSLSKK